MCQVHCKALGMAYEIRLCSQNVQSVVKEQKNKSMVFVKYDEQNNSDNNKNNPGG